jgi:hypothetical protein
LTEAIFQLLEEKGLLTRAQVRERIEQLRRETKWNFQMIQWPGAASISLRPACRYAGKNHMIEP